MRFNLSNVLSTSICKLKLKFIGLEVNLLQAKVFTLLLFLSLLSFFLSPHFLSTLLQILSFIEVFSCFLFIFKGKIPSDAVVNVTKLYKAPKQITILTLVASSFGMLFSLGCLMMNILHRKHRLASCWSLLIHVGLPLSVEGERVNGAFERPLDDFRCNAIAFYSFYMQKYVHIYFINE